MRREIAASMRAADFWRKLGAPPNDLQSLSPPWIGISELEHPPLYYAALAPPQRLVANQGVEAQLYLARLASVLLNLVVVGSAYGLVAEVFPRRHLLPVVVATFIAFLPAFTDLMSAVNNDTGAAAGVSLVLLLGARILRRGPSLRRIASILLLCALALPPRARPASSPSRCWRLLLGALCLRPGIVGAGRRNTATSCHSACRSDLGWACSSLVGRPAACCSQPPGDRCPVWAVSPGALGRRPAWRFAGNVRPPRTLFQELNVLDGVRLRGHTVTWGAWLKAPAGKGGTVALRLDDGAAPRWHEVQALEDWQFHAFTSTVGVDAPGVAFYVSLPKQDGAAGELLVDGVLLVDGRPDPLLCPSSKQPTQSRAGGGGSTSPT